MKFSDRVKYDRMKLELSQESLAKELGVSYFHDTKKLSLSTELRENLIWQI